MKYAMTRSLPTVCTGIILMSALFTAQVGEAADKDVGNRAYPFHDSYCFEYNGYNICYASQGMVQQTTTPSGNTAFIGNGTSSYTETDPLGKILYQDTLRYHTQGLTMNGVLAEMGQKFKSTLLVGDATCTTTYAFHFANDKIQLERNTSC